LVSSVCARGRFQSADRAEPTSIHACSNGTIFFPPEYADARVKRKEVAVNLEQLRKQAKELVRAARAGNEQALARVRTNTPERERIALADAQVTIARENGYPNWPALVAAAEANADAFILAATDRRKTRAQALLAARPEIETDPWARLVLGRDWTGDPNEPGGPRGWSPLLYVCHSCFSSPTLADELLRRGADPNATFHNEYGDMSALYGAAGVAHDPELTRVLLDAGASPNDGESLYHATEAEPACLRLLLEHGAETSGTNALAHALDGDRLEHTRLLLEAGAEPNEGALVAHAVRRGRGPEFLRLLAEHGADLSRPGGETWRGDVPLRTAYQHAILRGREDSARTLAELGASTEVNSGDLAVAAVARGEHPRASMPDELDPDAQEVLILSALRGRLELVVDLVGADFSGVVGGSPPGTLLQHAAWMGDAEIVRELLLLGADPGTGADSALGWAVHGSQNNRSPDADHVAVAELLVGAGSGIEPRYLDEADGPLHDWLTSQAGL
jgi:ankyrin repeat protein